MAYATGLRLISALCYFSIIGIPFGVVFHLLARKKEAEKESELETQKAMLEEMQQANSQ